MTAHITDLEKHRTVQSIAKRVLEQLGPTITASDTEVSIAQRATNLLSSHGVTETWYYNCLALVLLGSRSCCSISGRDYEPFDEEVGLTNLVTVDLSPTVDGVWGDCARSFFVEDGRCTDAPRNPEVRRGFQIERELHAELCSFVTPATTFEELFEFANARIQSLYCENLDFQGNLGHSIVADSNDRQYIEAGNGERLGAVKMFTFEPHIRIRGGTWGFKHEDIYYFSNGALEVL